MDSVCTETRTPGGSGDKVSGPRSVTLRVLSWAYEKTSSVTEGPPDGTQVPVDSLSVLTRIPVSRHGRLRPVRQGGTDPVHLGPEYRPSTSVGYPDQSPLGGGGESTRDAQEVRTDLGDRPLVVEVVQGPFYVEVVRRSTRPRATEGPCVSVTRILPPKTTTFSVDPRRFPLEGHPDGEVGGSDQEFCGPDSRLTGLGTYPPVLETGQGTEVHGR